MNSSAACALDNFSAAHRRHLLERVAEESDERVDLARQRAREELQRELRIGADRIRAHQSVEIGDDVVQRRVELARRTAVGVDHRPQTEVELFFLVRTDGDQEVFLGREPPVQRGARHARGRGDRRQRQLFRPALDDRPSGRGEDRLPARRPTRHPATITCPSLDVDLGTEENDRRCTSRRRFRRKTRRARVSCSPGSSASATTPGSRSRPSTIRSCRWRSRRRRRSSCGWEPRSRSASPATRWCWPTSGYDLQQMSGGPVRARARVADPSAHPESFQRGVVAAGGAHARARVGRARDLGLLGRRFGAALRRRLLPPHVDDARVRSRARTRTGRRRCSSGASVRG